MQAVPDPQQPAPKLKRRRPALTCTHCQRRKIRCDSKTPCNNCTKSNFSDCLYSDANAPVGRVARPSADAGRQIHRALAPRSSNPLPREDASRHSQQPSLGALISRVEILENEVSTLSRPAYWREHCLEFSAMPAAKDDVPARHTFANQSSWMNHTSLRSRVLQCLSEAHADNHEFRNAINECKTLNQRITSLINSGSDAKTTTQLGAGMPSKAVADQLLDVYFETFAGVFHVFHIPSFRAEYEEYWKTPESARDVFVVQVQVCMVLGTMASQKTFYSGDMSRRWLLDAHSWKKNRCTRWPQKQHPTFEELQLECLLYLAETSSPATERLVWMNAGDMVRMAMVLNLHRDPMHLGIEKSQEIELRRGLWATVMELNLLISLQAAQPPLIASRDWDTQAPGQTLDEKSSSRVPSAQPSLFKSLRLRAQITRHVTTAVPTLPYNDILLLHGQMAQAHEQLKKDLATENKTEPATGSHYLMASLVLSRYIMALHLPLLGRLIKDPTFHYSRRACASVALQMSETSGIAVAGDNEVGSNLQHLFVNNTGFFRGLVMLPVYAGIWEMIAIAEEHHDGTGLLPACDMNQIRQHADSCLAWMERRLEAGSMEIHGCCFVAACKAYASALYSGSDSHVDKQMIEAAFKSSKNCRDRLGEVLSWLESAHTMDAASSSAELTYLVEDFAGIEGSYDKWQGAFNVTGEDDFFGFDWTHTIEPVMFSESVVSERH